MRLCDHIHARALLPLRPGALRSAELTPPPPFAELAAAGEQAASYRGHRRERQELPLALRPDPRADADQGGGFLKLDGRCGHVSCFPYFVL